jgi:hypothetical protein
MAKKSDDQPDVHPNDTPDLADALRSIEAIGEDSEGSK